jgi:hypothetical protein
MVAQVGTGCRRAVARLFISLDRTCPSGVVNDPPPSAVQRGTSGMEMDERFLCRAFNPRFAFYTHIHIRLRNVLV